MKRHLKGFGLFVLIFYVGGVGIDLFFSLLGLNNMLHLSVTLSVAIGIYVWYWTVKAAKKKTPPIQTNKVEGKDFRR